MFRRQLKTYFFAKYWQDVLSALEIFLIMRRYINFHFSFFLTYLLTIIGAFSLRSVVVRCAFQVPVDTSRWKLLRAVVATDYWRQINAMQRHLNSVAERRRRGVWSWPWSGFWQCHCLHTAYGYTLHTSLHTPHYPVADIWSYSAVLKH